MIKSNTEISKFEYLAKGEKAYSCGDITGLKIRISRTKKVFYLFYKMDGKPYKYRIGNFGDIGLPEAKKVAKNLRAKIAIGENPQANRVSEREKAEKERKKSITLRVFLDTQYYTYIKNVQKAPDRTKQIIEHNFRDMMGKQLSNISVVLLDEWVSSRLEKGLKASTLNRAVITIKALLNVAVRWKLIDKNGLKGYGKLKTDKKGIVRFLSVGEETRLMKAVDKAMERGNARYIKCFITLLLNTGARPNEAKQIKWSDINMDEKLLTLQAAYTKTSQTRLIPINDKLMVELIEWKEESKGEDDDRLFKIVSTNKIWERVRYDAKLKNFRLYDLRHTFASKLAMNSVDLYTIAELLGHSNVEMTRVYAHLSCSSSDPI